MSVYDDAPRHGGKPDELARVRAKNSAAVPTFEVAGEPYLSGGHAARALSEAGDLSPSGAYQRLRRSTLAGAIRTVAVNRRHRWYHAGDVAQLAAELRSA
jgi:hypothetical protein